MSQLLPEGIEHLADCPYTVQEAITHGLRFLSYEEWPRDERPPKRIWMDGEKLNEHWDEVERNRKKRYSEPEEPEDEGEYTENAAASELIARG